MKKLFLIHVVVLCLAVGGAFAQKIAIVDLETAMNKTDAGVKANDELKADFEKARAKAQKISTEIETISKDLEAQRSVLSQDAVQKKLADIQKKKVELERLEKDTNEELQRKQMQFAGAIVQEMRGVIRKYAEEKKIDLVVEAKETGAVYAAPSLDITNEIVKRFNEQWKNKK